MIQICTVSGLSDLAALAAAADAGLLDTDGPARRVLLVSNEARIPELTPWVETGAGFGALAGRFDEVLSWNEIIAPLNPSGWTPRSEDRPLLERLLRRELGVAGAGLQLVLGSGTATPGRALAMIFRTSQVVVCSADLRSYGPTSAVLPTGMSSHIDRLLYLDLVPGGRPQLLAEYDVPAVAIPAESLRAVLGELGNALGAVVPESDRAVLSDRAALIAGSAQGDADAELTMLRGLAARGHSMVLFVPDPARSLWAAERTIAQFRTEAAELGVRLVIAEDPAPIESWCAAVRPALVVSGGSSALLTAARCLELPVACTGTRWQLDHLVPYEHEDRVPFTVVDTLLPHLSPDGTLGTPLIASEDVQSSLVPLLTAIAYCMRPDSRPELRKAAWDYLEQECAGPMLRYFQRRRLAALALPGAPAPPPDPDPDQDPEANSKARSGRFTTRLHHRTRR